MTPSGADLVRVDGPEDGVATVTLDRPDRKNALSIALRDQVSDTLDALAADEAARVVVLAGAGDDFCAGFDLAEVQQAFDDDAEAEAHDRRLWASSDRFHRTVLTFPLPTIAAVTGAALGGGFDLAVMCDLRVASDTAWFAHPERDFTEVVYGPLHELVGGSVARDLALTGRRVTAAEALELRLVSAVVPADRLPGEAAELAAQIATAPREVLWRMKAKIIGRADIATGRTLDL